MPRIRHDVDTAARAPGPPQVVARADTWIFNPSARFRNFRELLVDAMTRPTAATRTLILPLTMLLAVSSTAHAATAEAKAKEQPASDCAASGSYSFLCGLRNAEDMVRIPGTDWIVASGMAPGVGLNLIDARRKTWRALYPGAAPRAAHDRATYGACPGAPDGKTWVTHGLNIRAGEGGRSTLYVVAHGARESIEVFEVDASGARPTLTWIGCVLTPDGMQANSVASTADGALLATIPLRDGTDIAAALAGNDTGGVYAWKPGDDAFVPVEGSELPYANGIEVSTDGKEFYVASSGRFTIAAYANTNPTRPLRESKPLDIVPDNLHRDETGRLVTAGLTLESDACGDLTQGQGEFKLEAFASCPRPFRVWAFEPRTLAATRVAEGDANPAFSNITMAVPVAGTWWIGTFGGDCVAWRAQIP